MEHSSFLKNQCNGKQREGLLADLSVFFKTFDLSHPSSIAFILHAAREMVGGQFAIYHRFVLEKGKLCVQRSCGQLPMDFKDRGRLTGRICYEEFVSQSKAGILFNDLQQSPYWESDPDVKRHGLRAYAGAAVNFADIPIGSLAVYDSRVDCFNVDHVFVLEILARMISLSEQCNKALYTPPHTTPTGVKGVDLTVEAAMDEKIRSFLGHCLQSLGESLKVDTVQLFWRHSAGRNLETLAGWPQSLMAGTGQGRPHSIVACDQVLSALKTNGFFACQDSELVTDEALRCRFEEEDIRSLLLFPLGDFSIAGGICSCTMRRQARLWREEDLSILRTIMQIAGQWIEIRSIAHRLNESEALTSQIVQLSPTLIYRIDLVNHRFVHVNDQFCRILGYNEEEIRSIKPEDLLAPESRQMFRERLRKMATGRPVSSTVDYQLITKSGKVEWCHFHVSHFRDHGRIVGADVVAHVITDQKMAQEELNNYRRHLETLVEARTRELSEANQQLRKEIELHTQTAKELRLNSERLKELNTAMRVLLDKRNEERERAEENIRVNLKELIEPYLSRLEDGGLSKSQNQLIDLIRMNLDEVFGASIPEFSSAFLFFSPSELQVVNLIRMGKTTKEIARLLNISARTVEAYRNSIRKKLGLKNKKVNLRIYLSSKK